MKIRLGCVVSLGLAVGIAMSAAPLARAQQEMEHQGPSKYLYVTNVGVKPGMSHAFAKAEQAINENWREAKDPAYSLGMVPITGSERTIFLTGFDSFSDLQKVHDEMSANAKLRSEMQASDESRGAMVRNVYTSIYQFRKSLSLHTTRNLAEMRFLRVLIFHVKSEKEFESLAKMEVKALASMPEAHWAVYEKMYGEGSGNTFVVLTAMPSLSEIDTMIGNEKNVRAALGDPGRALMNAVAKKAIKSETSNLYAFSPELSYVPESWVTASPGFWGEK